MQEKYRQFSQKFFATELIALAFGFPVAAGYVLLLLNLSPENTGKIAIFSTIMALTVAVFLALPMNILVSAKVRKGVKAWYSTGITEKQESSDFYKALMSLNFNHGMLIFLRISLGSFACIVYMWTLGISPVLLAMSVVLSAYGAYLAGLIAFTVIGRLVSPIAQELLCKDILSKETVFKKKFFGLPVKYKLLFYLYIPLFVTNISLIFNVYASWMANVSYEVLLYHVIGDIVVSLITLLAFLGLTQRMIQTPLVRLENSLFALAAGKGDFRKRIPSDLSDDFAYVSYLMNKALDSFTEVLSKLQTTSGSLNESIQELTVSSQEISATANQQAAGVKEIVSTMEDSDQLSKKVASQAKEVATIAEGTKEVVNTGFSLLQQNLEKMGAIREANDRSIQGIRTLGNKITNIWEIVNIINNLADQTKIIAFNAELEAASAGEAGRNFQIVATEIRRLADSTVDSTKEIQKKITEIQNSSDHLIISSEEGTATIQSGWELSGRLRTLFEDIQSTSEISANSANQIAASIQQQVMAFDQILITLRQISAGIDNFVSSTGSTSRLSKNLMNLSKELHSMVEKYDAEQEART